MGYLFAKNGQNIDCENIKWVLKSKKDGLVRATRDSDISILQDKIAQVKAELSASGIDLIPAMSCSNTADDAPHYFLNASKFQIVLCGDSFHLQEIGLSSKFTPMESNFSAEMSLGDLRIAHPDMRQTFDVSYDMASTTDGEEPRLKWSGLMGEGSFPISEVVAIRLFERMEDKSFPGDINGDTIFIYPDTNKDGSLVDESKTFDADYLCFETAKMALEQAGVELIEMSDEQGQAYFVNAKYEQSVKAQLGREIFLDPEDYQVLDDDGELPSP